MDSFTMAADSITIRTATVNDAQAMAAVDRKSWPHQLAVTAEQYLMRIECYPSGQLVAVDDNVVIGTASAQRITAELLARDGHTYTTVTDHGTIARSHSHEGGIYQLLNVAVEPAARGNRLGRRLVDAQIDHARRLPSVTRIVGYTRPAGFHLHPGMSITEYLDLSLDDSNFDKVVAFHLNAGATIVSVQPKFRVEDREACGYGVLIEYP